MKRCQSLYLNSVSMEENHKGNRADPELEERGIHEITGEILNLTKEICTIDWKPLSMHATLGRNHHLSCVKESQSFFFFIFSFHKKKNNQNKAAWWPLSYLRHWFWKWVRFQWRDKFLPAQEWVSSQTTSADSRWASCRWSRSERRLRRSHREKGGYSSRVKLPCLLLCEHTVCQPWSSSSSSSDTGGGRRVSLVLFLWRASSSTTRLYSVYHPLLSFVALTTFKQGERQQKKGLVSTDIDSYSNFVPWPFCRIYIMRTLIIYHVAFEWPWLRPLPYLFLSIYVALNLIHW